MIGDRLMVLVDPTERYCLLRRATEDAEGAWKVCANGKGEGTIATGQIRFTPPDASIFTNGSPVYEPAPQCIAVKDEGILFELPPKTAR